MRDNNTEESGRNSGVWKRLTARFSTVAVIAAVGVFSALGVSWAVQGEPSSAKCGPTNGYGYGYGGGGYAGSGGGYGYGHSGGYNGYGYGGGYNNCGGGYNGYGYGGYGYGSGYTHPTPPIVKPITE